MQRYLGIFGPDVSGEMFLHHSYEPVTSCSVVRCDWLYFCFDQNDGKTATGLDLNEVMSHRHNANATAI